MTTATLTIPGFSLRADNPAPTLPGLADPGPMTKLTDRHRPRRLADMVGQAYAVDQLESFVAAPHSTAFLFTGPTGVGKTTAALALAEEMGATCFLSGLRHIRSGDQDAEAVEDALDTLRFPPMLGSGWRVVVVDEADHASEKARMIWLSALESLPPRCIIVFTTNKPEKMQDRFIDRCERIDFADDAATLLWDAQMLIDDVWEKEGGEGDPPRAADMAGLVRADGTISFRRAVKLLEPKLRTSRTSRRPAAAPSGPDGPPAVLAAPGHLAAPVGPVATSPADLPAPRPSATMSAAPAVVVAVTTLAVADPVDVATIPAVLSMANDPVDAMLAEYERLYDRYDDLGEECQRIDNELIRLHPILSRAGRKVRRLPE